MQVSRVSLSLAWPIVASVAYFVAAEAAFYVGTLSDKIFAPFWPPNAVLFCVLLATSYRQWWIFILAVAPAHVLAEMQVGMPPFQMAVAFATNCAVAALNAWSTRRLLLGSIGLATAQHAVLYILTTACLIPSLIALGGAFVRIVGEGHMEEYWVFWLQWFASNALAQIALGPIALTLVTETDRFFKWPDRNAWVELVTIAVGLAAACIVAFRVPFESAFFPAVLYAPLPFAIWGAVRFGVMGASSAILAITAFCIGTALRSDTMFSGADPESNVLALQLFLAGLLVPLLLVGAAVEGMRRAERRSAELSRAVLNLYDEGRRQTALELHEGACQDLTAASMLASRLTAMTDPDCASDVLDRVQETLKTCINRLRSATRLLHPPLLEEAGLQAALEGFVTDFRRRTGVAVQLDLAPAVSRLPRDVEMALFRVVQEALENVSQHSGSPTARVQMSVGQSGSGRTLKVSVEDNGIGMQRFEHVLGRAPEIAEINLKSGVGLASVRERLNRVGGKLLIDSSAGKTVITALVRMESRVV